MDQHLYSSDDPFAHPITVDECLDAIRRVTLTVEAWMDAAVRDLGSTYAQYLVLRELERGPNVHAAGLAMRLGITRQSASGLVSQLDRATLVDRARLDGRVRLVTLTPRGRRWLVLAGGATDPVRERAASRLTYDERAALLRAIRHIERDLWHRRIPPWWD
jgi:DNA-binding MarR family transcriptional regulator